MKNSDMRHMEFLETVAANDVEVLRAKEATYQGSWKRRGGVGAFMMLARKWDRLENMLSTTGKFGGGDKDAPPYDIFKWIECYVEIDKRSDRGVIGSDGTSLAEIRDLRQYLLLVEAEMMARGVVASPKQTIRTISADFDAVIADDTVHERDKRTRPATDEDRELAAEMSRQMRRVPRFERETSTRHRVGEVETAETVIERTFEEPASPPRTPENGGQHAALAPHVVGASYALRKDIEQGLFDVFWNRRGGDIYVLEPHVISSRIPRLLRQFYNSRGESWTLRPETIPADARDFFPRLSREHNMKEHEELPEWQRVLYTWSEEKMKHELAEQNAAWTGEVS